jgi:hypothetical protein
MAVVSLSEDKDFPVCGFAAWALDKLVRDVKPDLPAGSGLQAAFAHQEDTRLEWLNLENVDEAEMAAFGEVLRGYLGRLEDQGPASFASPEFFPGYVDNIRELLELVERRAT